MELVLSDHVWNVPNLTFFNLLIPPPFGFPNLALPSIKRDLPLYSACSYNLAATLNTCIEESLSFGLVKTLFDEPQACGPSGIHSLLEKSHRRAL